MPTILNSANQTITQYNVQSGTALNTLNQIPPSTATFVLTSNGAAAQPSFQAVAASGAVISVDVDAHTAPGTDPVVPDGTGKIAITGGQVTAGTTPSVIQTNSLNANSFVIQVQRSDAVGATDVTQNGVSHFDNHVFAVDGNGFVTIPQTKVLFNPILTFAGGTTGITYTSSNGEYIQFNNIVFFNWSFTLSNKGSSTGEAQVTMPFTNISGIRLTACLVSATLPGGNTYLVGAYESGTNYITLGAFGATFANLDDTNFTNTTQAHASGFVFLN